MKVKTIFGKRKHWYLFGLFCILSYEEMHDEYSIEDEDNSQNTN